MELLIYRTAAGQSPFEQWRARLDETARARVTAALARLQTGHFGNVKSAGSGVLEIRIDFGPGYRVYFGRDGQDVVLLLTGGDKRRQQRDINEAITYWADYRRRKRQTDD